MKERKTIHKRYIAWLITESKTNNLETLSDAMYINCYATSRLLTYPDRNKRYYSPGRIYNLKYGQGEFTKKELDPYFMDKGIMRDSQVLNQPCTRVNFEDIEECDGYHYFGICKFHICPSKVTNSTLREMLKHVDDSKMEAKWHFIFRLSTGNWLHKPNFEEPIDVIDWKVYGENFIFNTYNKVFGVEVPVEAVCFREFFYRIDQKFDLFLGSDLLNR